MWERSTWCVLTVASKLCLWGWMWFSLVGNSELDVCQQKGQRFESQICESLRYDRRQLAVTRLFTTPDLTGPYVVRCHCKFTVAGSSSLSVLWAVVAAEQAPLMNEVRHKEFSDSGARPRLKYIGSVAASTEIVMDSKYKCILAGLVGSDEEELLSEDVTRLSVSKSVEAWMNGSINRSLHMDEMGVDFFCLGNSLIPRCIHL